jgi:hypothetical protein
MPAFAAHGCPALPADYVAFLKKSNGAMGEGFLLYPLRAAESDAASIVNATIKERKKDNYDRCHVIGFVHYELMPVVRDWATGEYQWHDETGSLMARFTSLEGLLDDRSGLFKR